MTQGTQQTQQTIRSINNQKLPSSGPKAVPFNFNFGSQNSYQIDLSLSTARNFVDLIQTVYIDNSGNNAPLYLSVGSPTIQQIIAPPLSQGFYSILLPDPPVMIVACAGGDTSTSVLFLNVPIPPNVWYPISGTPSYDGNGNLKTADQNLATVLVSGYMQSQEFGRGSGDALYPSFVDGTWTNASLSGATQTAYNVLGGPAVGSFFLKGCDISLSGDAYLAAAGELTLTLYRGPDIADLTTAVAIAKKTIYLPGAIPASPQPTIPLFSFQGAQYHNATSATAFLHMGISAALAGGVLSGNFFGGLTSLEN